MRKFSLKNNEYSSPSTSSLREKWKNVPNEEARNLIALEYQYLLFHHYLLKNLQHEDVGGSDAIPVGLSIRAGIIKTLSMLCASIAEATLRAHAEKRGYDLNKDHSKRTYGNVLYAWGVYGNTRKPNEDVEEIAESLRKLADKRNYIHLYKSLMSDDTFYDSLSEENRLISEYVKVMKCLRSLTS